MRSLSTVALAAVAASLISLAGQARASVIVDSTTDIFLASQPNGASVTGFFGTDTAPANSPVKFDVTPGGTLTFAATGSTSVAFTGSPGDCFAGPDGGCFSDESGFSPAPASNTYKGPSEALIGVFLGPGVTSVQDGEASLDYSDLANQNPTSYAPDLNQIFFIGDGVNGDGVVQQFVAPSGAGFLYLAVADSIGASTGNGGFLTVDVTGARLDAGLVPEPATWGLMLLGFGGLGASLRLKRRRAALA
jgi:large repetitive protein